MTVVMDGGGGHGSDDEAPGGAGDVVVFGLAQGVVFERLNTRSKKTPDGGGVAFRVHSLWRRWSTANDHVIDDRQAG
ncbi:hypothetical protein J4H86_00090 [Spiractinospora alimapuensis]|uniref:hypothetical protein n=1 Tax=Spiractinospora alimapuensis TaxID=2820884 RepID=UPI001F186250|nr:hypothetical protein [Spiractinospora alimapuensis]QVQ52316.1 hypothetical protein J4H86_00090 [Spiractinospora alimapuensis]